MKGIAVIILISLLLRGCAGRSEIGMRQSQPQSDATQSREKSEELRAVWLTQFDMTRLYLSGGRQRNEDEFTRLADNLMLNLKSVGINTAFLQMRPNGDSMSESKFYPVSRYVSGAYGRALDYDAVKILLEKAVKHGIVLHAWINPFRLMTAKELECVGDCTLYRWYKRHDGRVVEYGGRLYLNPAFAEVRALIADGAAELLRKYDFAGVHIDDYFYPTSDASFDRNQFDDSGYASLADFRRDNITKAVSCLYKAVKQFSSDKVFGVSPAGNIYSLYDGYYVDVGRWCELGIVDYLMPQLYFGYLNKYCPFETVLADWISAVCAGKVKLYIGLSAAKAAAAERDIFAGSEEGKSEWIDYGDVLRREMRDVEADLLCGGWCLFCVSSIFDVITGEMTGVL